MKALTIWQPYLAGVLHGDGWCTSRSIGLRSKDHDFAALFAEAINTLFATAARPRRDERGYWLIRLGNRSGRFDGLRDCQPRDNDDLSSWLRGLFDSEGNAQLWLNRSAGPCSFHRRVAIYSTDLGTLCRASEYLDWLDIPNTLRATKSSASHKGTKTVHELRIVRREGFARFLEMVGSSIQRKQATLTRIVETYQPPGWQARNWAKTVAARWPK